jgi:hypothetical protein
MGELRSSREIAREKADRLGSLSTEEKEQQKEAAYRSMAQAIVKEYFGGRGPRYLDKELNKYAGDEKEYMRRMVLDCLIEAIDLDNGEKSGPVLNGISALQAGKNTEAYIEEIAALYEKYRDALDKEKRRMSDEGLKALQDKGISGSAVKVIDTGPDAEKAAFINSITVSFKEKIEELGKKYIDRN